MLEDYLREIDELISSATEALDVEILRRSVWDTGLEKVALYRYRLSMSDGSLLELTEYAIAGSHLTAETRRAQREEYFCLSGDTDKQTSCRYSY